MAKPKESSTATRQTRGRPRAFDVDAVLEAALELFWKDGYRATTTRELEAALGLSQSSIYNAFGSKRELLEAAMDRYEGMTDRRLLRPLEESSDGVDAIDRFFVGLHKWVTSRGRRGCMLINMMAEDGGDTSSITQRANAYRSRVRGALMDGLERAADNGEFSSLVSKSDLRSRTNLLVASVLGLNIAARGGVSSAELKGLLEAVRGQLKGWRVQ